MLNNKYVKNCVVHGKNPLGILVLMVSVDIDGVHKKVLEKVNLLVDYLYNPVHCDKQELKVTLYHILEMFPEDLTAKNIVAETNFNFKEALFIKDFLARD